ncbi:MAG: phosphoglycerate dehydrogenase [Prolixibacteraceae bacterium]|jgi:phosphoglycerate dehydrogenase-like enzyme|nr:phosphoglycerate dehydrogenase [Prolixibacteraceae bacterium]
MKKILITPRSITKDGHPSLDRLRNAGYELAFCTPGKQPSENELINILPGCSGYLAGVEKISAKVLSAASGLRVISRNGVGVDNIDLNAAKALNIEICKTEGANARGVAELTISLIFAITRSIPFADGKLKEGQWERRLGIEIKGRTLGIIGCGRIGKEVACLALGLGMNVIAFDPFINDFFTPAANFRYAELDELLANSDIISLHIPAGKDGKPFVNDSLIQKIKKRVFLINTARGELIDDDALIQALDAGIIMGYATDVFRTEPPGDNILVKHKRVITTPHIGGFTEESVDKAMNGAVDNLLKYLK